jgi:transcriptional regulator with XRE-family HTH domain
VPAIHVDVAALRAALDATREARALSWRETARQIGVSASTMSRMTQGQHPDVNAFVRMLWWLGMPHDMFTVNDGQDAAVREPELVAQLTPLLCARPDLSDHDVRLVTDLVGAVVRHVKSEA